PKGFLPKSDEAQFQLSVRMPEGTSLDSTLLVTERVAREMREKIPEVTSTLVTIGEGADKTPNVAGIFVKIVNPDQRAATQDDIMDKVRREITSKMPKEYRVSVSNAPLFGGAGAQAAVMYVVTGPEFDELGKQASVLLQKFKQVPGVVDADSNLIIGKPEVSAYIDRSRAADLGVQVPDVASTLQMVVGGLDVSTYVENGNLYDVRLRDEPSARASIEDIGQLTVPSARLGAVPLTDVVRLEREEGPSQISRMNRQRQIMLTANTAPGVSTGQIVEQFDKVIAESKLPAGYAARPAGQSREIGRTVGNFALAFALAFVFMYLILAAQFESWIHPVTILLSLPLTVPFALISLLVFKQALDMYSMLGLLVLFGVVKKNSILQIDHTNQLRREGLPRLEAIVHGSKDRLRPILMTTLSFVAGMIPLLMSKGVGASFNQATAGVVVGGQTLSLVLTLLVTPVAYSLFDDASAWFSRKFASKRTPEETGEAEVARAYGGDTLSELRPAHDSEAA
ncbi:MAG TPA: efflux RND transporter permease subunit, partial [Archangium sp.]|nr:efflux RND transporter permease subunit [Archangium sp.]